MRKNNLLSFTLSLLLVAALADATYAQICSDPELAQKINQLLSQPKYRADSWGIQVLDLETAKVIYSKNEDKNFIPASNTKLFTTATALAKLRPDFRFKTQVYTTGPISASGVLHGNLVLEGRGDPTLSHHFGSAPSGPFAELAQQIAARGIKQIAGDIVGDDSYFVHSTVKIKTKWGGDFEKELGVPVSALSVGGGFIRLYAAPGDGVGKRVVLNMEPETGSIRIINKAVTSSRGTKRRLRVIRESWDQVYISGRLPINTWGARYSIPVDDPPYFAAMLLKEALEKAGIKVSGKVKSNHSYDSYRPGEIWVLAATYESLPLIKLIEIINKESRNVYAEMLLRILGAELKDEGSREAGLEAEREFLAEIGIHADDTSLADGSGLSKQNLTTPRAITRLLEYMHKAECFQPFFNSLAVAGVDGTLKHRFASTKERIHAKTGTLSNACSLSGYISTACGRQVIFSIMANRFRVGHYRIRSTIDDICNLIANNY